MARIVRLERPAAIATDPPLSAQSQGDRKLMIKTAKVLTLISVVTVAAISMGAATMAASNPPKHPHLRKTITGDQKADQQCLGDCLAHHELPVVRSNDTR